MTTMTAEPIQGGGAHARSPVGGGASSVLTTQTRVLRSITKSGVLLELPRTLTLTLEDGTWIVDDAASNAFGTGTNVNEAFADYVGSLGWLIEKLAPAGHEVNQRQASAARAMLDALAP